MKAVKMGMSVYGTDNRAGRVDDVLLDAQTRQPSFLVIDAGGFFKGDVIVPFDRVQNVNDAGVWLSMTQDEVKHADRFDAARHGSQAGLVSQSVGRYGRE